MYEAPHEQVSLYTTLNRFSKACRSLTENQLWSFRVLWKQRSFTFTTALCLIKLLSSCRMLLDIEPKYGSCNETYLGEGEGSAGAPRCCVTPCFLFKNCWMQRSKKLLGYPLRDNNLIFRLVKSFWQKVWEQLAFIDLRLHLRNIFVETFEWILRLHKAQQREKVNYDRLETVRKQWNSRLSLEKVLIKESYLLRTFDADAGIVPNGLR